jgi:NAD(P)-dependent dehydrogenase (short-subunit alcohol dehydrogenase family)
MDLHDRVVLITGAKRIGAVVATGLAVRGAHIAIACHRSREEAERVVDAVRALGRQSDAWSADLREPSVCRNMVDDVAAAFGRLDALVNMASVYVRRGLDELTLDDWETAMHVDLRAAFLCAHAAVPHMRRGRGGRVVNVADWVAASGRPRYRGYLPYYVAKAGVIALTEALALELAADGILVNAVAPGPIMPPPGMTEAERANVEAATPLGRWGGEIEIAKAVTLLIETDFVTGETIRVDGGRHVR